MNPLPELGRWADAEDVDQRLRTAPEELYAWYRRAQGMMLNVLRDEEIMPNRQAEGHRVSVLFRRGS